MVIETALDLMKKNQFLNSLLSTRKRTILTSSRTVQNAMITNQCMFTDNYHLSFCFWVFEKKLTQENCFLFCEKYEKINDLNGLLKLENVPFNILSYRFECNDAMHVHRQL